MDCRVWRVTRTVRAEVLERMKWKVGRSGGENEVEGRKKWWRKGCLTLRLWRIGSFWLL